MLVIKNLPSCPWREQALQSWLSHSDFSRSWLTLCSALPMLPAGTSAASRVLVGQPTLHATATRGKSKVCGYVSWWERQSRRHVCVRSLFPSAGLWGVHWSSFILPEPGSEIWEGEDQEPCPGTGIRLPEPDVCRLLQPTDSGQRILLSLLDQTVQWTEGMHHQTFPATLFSLVLFHSQNPFYIQKNWGQEIGEAVCGTPKPCTSVCLLLSFFVLPI